MITDADKKIVEDIVKEFVGKKWSFTAYTITTEARKKGVNASHSELKLIVHDMYKNKEMGDYGRRTEDVGAPIKPFLYFSPNDTKADDDVLVDELDALDDKVDKDIKSDKGDVSDAIPVPANIPVVAP